LLDGPDDGQNAREFRFSGDSSSEGGSLSGSGGRAGTGGFASDVEDIRAFIEKREAMGDAGLGVEVKAAVREGIGRNVEYAHDEGSLTEEKCAAA
jgi:hypothetical protein